jgi:hypothetical protein
MSVETSAVNGRRWTRREAPEWIALADSDLASRTPGFGKSSPRNEFAFSA